jgi:alanine racemase
MPGLVPVVKGNGYGFRRWNLMPLAGQLSNEVAVGTVFEARDIPSNVTPIVLTPTLTAPPKNLPLNTVMTISSPHHVIALNSAGWTGEVIVKLQSSAMRYGVEKSMLQSLLSDIENARLTVRGLMLDCRYTSAILIVLHTKSCGPLTLIETFAFVSELPCGMAISQ